MKTQPGVFNAPQFGLGKMKVKIVKPVEFTPKQIDELGRLMRELERRDLSGVIRK